MIESNNTTLNEAMGIIRSDYMPRGDKHIWLDDNIHNLPANHVEVIKNYSNITIIDVTSLFSWLESQNWRILYDGIDRETGEKAGAYSLNYIWKHYRRNMNLTMYRYPSGAWQIHVSNNYGTTRMIRLDVHRKKISRRLSHHFETIFDCHENIDTLGWCVKKEIEDMMEGLGKWHRRNP